MYNSYFHTLDGKYDTCYSLNIIKTIKNNVKWALFIEVYDAAINKLKNGNLMNIKKKPGNLQMYKYHKFWNTSGCMMNVGNLLSTFQ